jgi:formamidopyrimidine-DNA glycosylase
MGVPELPDVEGYRRFLAKHARGHKIVRVDAPDRVLVRNRTPWQLNDALKNRPFEHPSRHGKWLIAPVDGVELLLHFGMTGLLSWRDTDRDRHLHDRIIFVTDRGELRYNNMRRFGGVWLAGDEHERDQVTGPLGPDAAAIDRDTFEALIRQRRGGIKAALMDQRLIAGVGNLLSDEILWRAHVHPKAATRSLSAAQRRRLYDALHAAVGESIRYGRVPHGRRWLTRVRDTRDAACPRCGAPLQRATVAGRTAVWCPREQR